MVLIVAPDSGRDGSSLGWQTIASVIVMAVAVAVRRVRPGLALALATVAMAIQAAFTDAEQGLMLLAGLVIYTTTIDSRTRRVTVFVVVLIPVVRLFGGRDREALSDAIGDLLIGVTAVAVGLTVASRRRERTALREREAQAESARESERTLAASEERAHIARELHDIIAHSVTAMTLQARGAYGLAASNPALVDSVLGRIERTGSEAMADLRRSLDLLARSEDDASRTPPGLSDIDALVVDYDDVQISVEWVGDRREVPSVLGLAAFRIVQESITNARRHGAATTIRVRIAFVDKAIALRITDDGAGVAVLPGTTHAGRGLDGMRERARVCDGHIDAGPLPSGGWRVEALLRERRGADVAGTT